MLSVLFWTQGKPNCPSRICFLSWQVLKKTVFEYGKGGDDPFGKKVFPVTFTEDDKLCMCGCTIKKHRTLDTDA